MKKQFELVCEFEPAGDQPTAIASLVEGLNNGEMWQTLLGVTGSGKTFTIANVAPVSYTHLTLPTTPSV